MLIKQLRKKQWYWASLWPLRGMDMHLKGAKGKLFPVQYLGSSQLSYEMRKRYSFCCRMTPAEIRKYPTLYFDSTSFTRSGINAYVHRKLTVLELFKYGLSSKRIGAWG